MVLGQRQWPLRPLDVRQVLVVAQEYKWGLAPELRGEALLEDLGSTESVGQRRRQALTCGEVVSRSGEVAPEQVDKPISAGDQRLPSLFSHSQAPFLPADTCAVDRGHSPTLLPV